MFTIWAREFKDNKMIKNMTIRDDREETRTHKVFDAIERVCYEFDLSKPIWLDSNIAEFKKLSKVRFRKDSFVDEVDFDYLEVSVIEEDEWVI